MKTGLKGFLALLAGFVVISLFWYIISSQSMSDGYKKNIVKVEYKSLTPCLLVPDVNETINFYSDVFGFEKKESFLDAGEYRWAIMEKDSLKIMLRKNEEISAGEGNISLVISVDNIDELYGWLKEKCEIVEKMQATPQGGKEFSAKDNNGYVIVFRM